MNTITKKIILPLLIGGTALMYGCGDKNEEHVVTHAVIQGIELEGVTKQNNGYVFWDRDGKPGFDAITGSNSFGYIHFASEKDPDNEYGVIMSDSTKKYVTRLQEDLEKIEYFTKLDFQNASQNK
ncbi:MAG: hypothetical protein ACP5N3_06095 [Candidatus Nanoarchaeia archaeon]